ncbi:signal peptidase II [Natronocella acetinitrilica]|jgi:signal peptidase II|uniref:Lipoprotein signal peptidase n=1 Tax=Natronocella acetinitrilica TaxID=414046 RepID=A0AAE3G1D9_9GAMM|nr:signal peptidase II [Natronocella acetinitrilica]MCP1673800.1 signal peptidase II [Natronocella acetinitrilica]
MDGNLRKVPWLTIAIAVVVIDQLTKVAAEQYLEYLRPVPLLPFLNLTLSYNPGAAFSFLGDASGWQRWLFTGFALVVSVVLVVWLRRLPANERWLAWGLALLLGGAIGNVIDRLIHGHVIDFIHVYYDRWHYPIFNIADSAITIGVAMILVHAFFLDKRGSEDQVGS